MPTVFSVEFKIHYFITGTGIALLQIDDGYDTYIVLEDEKKSKLYNFT